MKIKLYAQEIELFKVEDNVSNLEPRLTGKAKVLENKIYFDGQDPFCTLLHEILHFFINKPGFHNIDKFSHECVCDIFGSCIEQLMLENGNDIFQKLKDFAEN